MCMAQFYSNVLFFAQEDSATYSSWWYIPFSIHRDSFTTNPATPLPWTPRWPAGPIYRQRVEAIEQLIGQPWEWACDLYLMDWIINWVWAWVAQSWAVRAPGLSHCEKSRRLHVFIQPQFFIYKVRITISRIVRWLNELKYVKHLPQ